MKNRNALTMIPALNLGSSPATIAGLRLSLIRRPAQAPVHRTDDVRHLEPRAHV